MIPVVTWDGYLAMAHFFQNSATSNTSSSFKFVCRFWAWLLVVVPPTHWRSSKVSEMNCDKPARWRTNNSAKQRKAKKSWVGGNLHLIAARNTAKWWWLSSAAKFPPFRPLFAAIRSTLILTLPPACVRACGTKQLKESDMTSLTLFLFLAQNLIHCFSVFSSILAQVYLTFPFESSATSSKISISLRKWKLHHLRRVSIKLEGRRNGNVEIENPSSGKQNTKRKKGKWKLEKRKSQHWKTKSKKKENIKSYASDFFF